MSYRIEKDCLGEVRVPKDRLWGAQTERSRRNFRIGKQIMPTTIICALILLKKCCAIANFKSGKLSKEKKDAIVEACEQIQKGQMMSHFPLVVWQTGSGTQTNMNVNEVIANLCQEQCVHPNDDVNMSQSTNDVFPTALHMACVVATEKKLIPEIERMISTAKILESQNANVLKVGRTHLMDATPIAFSQEISGWRGMLMTSLEMIKTNLVFLKRLAIGGSAVGTGINTPKNFSNDVIYEINRETKMDFCEVENKFYALQSRDAICNFHGTLTALATNLNKIANDVRWLASGPVAGLNEIVLPENEPGSSIMPGKVNPTQCEALSMVACEVIGNNTTVSVAAASGNFELNVYLPLFAFKMMESICLLADGISSFVKNCFSGIKANKEKMQYYVENSLMTATVLTPQIGYEKAAELVQFAKQNNISIIEANEKLNVLEPDKLKRMIASASKL